MISGSASFTHSSIFSHGVLLQVPIALIRLDDPLREYEEHFLLPLSRLGVLSWNCIIPTIIRMEKDQTLLICCMLRAETTE